MDGIHPPLLPLRQGGGLVHLGAVGLGGTARHILKIAVHLIGPPGQILIDGIVFYSTSPSFLVF